MSSQPIFSVRTESRNDVCCVRLAGEMDMAAVPILQNELTALGAAPANLLIDLSGLKFVDSSGLKYLIELHQGQSADDTIELIDPSDQVSRLIELTGTEFLVTSQSDSRLLAMFAGPE